MLKCLLNKLLWTNNVASKKIRCLYDTRTQAATSAARIWEGLVKFGEECEMQPTKIEQYFCNDRRFPFSLCLCMLGRFYCISFYGIIYFIVSKWCYMLNEDSAKNRNKGKEILFSKCNFCIRGANLSMRTQSDRK